MYKYLRLLIFSALTILNPTQSLPNNSYNNITLYEPENYCWGSRDCGNVLKKNDDNF